MEPCLTTTSRIVPVFKPARFLSVIWHAAARGARERRTRGAGGEQADVGAGTAAAISIAVKARRRRGRKARAGDGIGFPPRPHGSAANKKVAPEPHAALAANASYMDANICI